MSEELLDRPQIHSSLEEMGGKGVPQRVWMKTVEIRGAAHGFVENTPHRAVGEAAAALVDEEGLVAAAVLSPPRRPMGQVLPNGGLRPPAEGDDPFLAPLAADPQQTLGQREIIHVQRHEFADPEAGPV